VTTQFAEQLLEVRQRDLLALRQNNHGGDRKTAFGGETHGKLLQVWALSTN
jgi:hypothetical protein